MLERGAAILLAAATLMIAPTAASAFTAEQEQLMREWVQVLVDDGAYPGLTVGVWRGENQRFVFSAGSAVLPASSSPGRPMQAKSPTRIGSVTKTLTGTVILQLVQEGRVRLRDPVSRYFHRLRGGRRITVRMLLNHTSGLRTIPHGVENTLNVWQWRSWSLQRLMRRTFRLPRLAPPGERFNYSDAGFITLGRIAERVTGRSLGRLFQRRVFEPLGLTHASYRNAVSMPRGAVHGYFRLTPDAPFADTRGWNYSYLGGAGAAVSTLEDLRRLAPAIATGTGLLGHRMQRKRLDQMVAIPGSEGTVHYGLGLYRERFEPGGTYLGHDGEIAGYSAWMGYSPGTRTTILMLGNASPDLLQTPSACNTTPPIVVTGCDNIDVAFELASIVARG
jgi:D-alanyl-D-alanine carboxypeptidase